MGPKTSEKSKSSVGGEEEEDFEGGIVRVSLDAKILCRDLLGCDVDTIFLFVWGVIEIEGNVGRLHG